MKKKDNKNNKVPVVPKGNYNGSDITNEKREIFMSLLNDPKVPLKYKKFIKLLEKGNTLKDSAKLMGYNEKHGYEIGKKLMKYSLKNEKLVKKSYKVLDDIISNKPKLKKVKVDKKGNKKEIVIYPSHQNQIRVAEMVYDRYEPVIKGPLVNITNNLSPIDLSKYRVSDGGVGIEVKGEEV